MKPPKNPRFFRTGSVKMGCEISGQTFVCELIDADVDDSLMADVPPFQFEPIGRSLQQK